jgi:hypothetical protein
VSGVKGVSETGALARQWWFAAPGLLGILGGVVWWGVAKPAMWIVTSQGVTLSENQSRHQFGVVISFVVVGAVISFLFGVVITLRAREHWVLVPAVATTSGLAAVVAWQVGKLLGPDGPTRDTHGAVGTHVSAALAVGTAAPFVMWSVFGVAGVMIGTWLLHHRDSRLDR